MITRVKGTQDFLDVRLMNYLIAHFKKHLQLYNFTEIATPIVEPLELFQRSLGEETDVVSKEMFIIKSSDEEKEAICLRPEITASIVRAFIENHVTQVPWKIYNWGPVFRYERPQKGRYRQFHQFDIEVIGSPSVVQDAQFIKMLDRFFHESLKINNYAILLNFLGCAQDRADYRERVRNFLNRPDILPKICDTCKIRKDKNVLRIFDCKNPSCQEVYNDAPTIVTNLCDACMAEWELLQKQLQLLSVSFAFQPRLVRGLDYYSKTVFEFSSNSLGAQSAFCGGGRFDHLVSELGGKEDQPSIGAAAGIERLLLVMQARQEPFRLEELPALHVVMPVAKEQQTLALLVADHLQAQGLCADVFVDGDSLKSMFRKADKMGAHYCLIIGEQEQLDQTVTVKNLRNGTQETVAQRDVVAYLKK